MNREDFLHIGNSLLFHNWIFAKTMPQYPHWYTLRKQWNDDKAFDEAVIFIRHHGYKEKFKGRIYTLLNFDNMKYWSMGAPIKDTILINRAEIKSDLIYDSLASEYDSFYQDEKSLKENQNIFSMINPKGTILDIGCGTGLFADYAKINPESYVGIDPSEMMLKRFSDKHPEYTNRLVRTKFEDFIGKKYDMIVSLFGAISYVKPEYLSWIPEMLNPCGKFFLMF